MRPEIVAHGLAAMTEGLWLDMLITSSAAMSQARAAGEGHLHGLPGPTSFPAISQHPGQGAQDHHESPHWTRRAMAGPKGPADSPRKS